MVVVCVLERQLLLETPVPWHTTIAKGDSIKG